MAGDVQAEPVEAKAPGAAGHVLIADDNAVNALLATRALTAAGFRVDCAATGAEALERASETLYAVIFMDIRMPVMDGLEATRRIRRLGGPAAATPIIALTADIDPALEVRARAAGVTAMAAKPIDPPRLRQLAETWAIARQAALK
jgi:CheY-like chemotaxis protein